MSAAEFTMDLTLGLIDDLPSKPEEVRPVYCGDGAGGQADVTETSASQGVSLEKLDVHSFIAQHYHDLVTIARSVRRSRGADLKMETGSILSEAWIRISRTYQGKRVTFNDLAHFRAVVRRTMIHVAIDRYRRDCAERRGAGAVLVTVDEDRDAGMGNQETLCLLAELFDGLRQIAPVQAEVFELRYIAGLDHAEIMEACGLTDNQVRSCIRKAWAWMADRLYSASEPGRRAV